MAPSMRNSIMLSVALIVISLIVPIGVAYLSSLDSTTITLANGTAVTFSDVVDPTVVTLLSVLMPIIAVIGLMLYFIPKGKK